MKVGERIGIYGPGGIGKTTLALSAPGPVAVIDLDGSLSSLSKNHETATWIESLNVQVVEIVKTFSDLRAVLQGDGWDSIKTVIIDTMTHAEELASEHVIATIPHEKGGRITRIEDYGWGKGYTFIYDTMLLLLADLERHRAAGRNIILVMHDCTSTVPNPSGDDWIRYEPRLQHAKDSQKNNVSVRAKIIAWLDHLFFIGYDVIAKDGKAQGSGTRAIYPQEMPHLIAKSRQISDVIVYPKGDTTLWNLLFPVAS